MTPFGRRVAVLFTKAHGRVLAPGLTWLHRALPAEISQRSPLAKAWRHLDETLDEVIADRLIAA